MSIGPIQADGLNGENLPVAKYKFSHKTIDQQWELWILYRSYLDILTNVGKVAYIF